MEPSHAHVPLHELQIDAAGVARSAQFDDVYFSARGGVAETEHVFLAGNDLPQRWQGRRAFTIGELGFGTGLNFLVALQRHRAACPAGRLHFISVEKYPLTPDQLRAALAHHPGLHGVGAELFAQYPLRLPGWHRLSFYGATLTLGFGEAAALLSGMEALVDAWFLDGFSPAKNPGMWSHEVLAQVARLSAPDATAATFTAAGAVRRGLQEVGFAVEKQRGFGHKRDMLRARFVATSQAPRAPVRDPVRTALVVGGGIAGCSAARALAERGVRVTLLEAKQLAHGASGNPAAVLYPQLTKTLSPASLWHWSGYDFMLRKLAQWRVQGLAFGWDQPGMLRIGADAADEVKLRTIRDRLRLDPAIARWVEREEAAALAGTRVAHGGFWFAQGSWIAPAELCRELARYENIERREGIAATAWDGHCLRTDMHEGLEADAVLFANAQAVNGLLNTPLTLGANTGQISAVRTAPVLRSILCHQGYAIQLPQHCLIGATYDRGEPCMAVTQANHDRNIRALQAAAPALAVEAILGGRTASRAATPTRLPYVGEIAEGVYVSVGHGSRGMISAPLAAEVLAACLTGEPLPVGTELLRALTPRRG